MTTSAVTNRDNNTAATLTHLGQMVSRYGLAVVLAWIGFGKYVKMEARVLIEHSPLMSWIYEVLSVSTVARGLGTMEIVAALLIAIAPLSPRLSAIGSALAVVLFMGTLSFLFTTPGVVSTHAAGIPVLSAQPGQFLLKDMARRDRHKQSRRGQQRVGDFIQRLIGVDRFGGGHLRFLPGGVRPRRPQRPWPRQDGGLQLFHHATVTVGQI